MIELSGQLETLDARGQTGDGFVFLQRVEGVRAAVIITFIFAVLIVVFNLIADVLYGILDPRIRYD